MDKVGIENLKLILGLVLQVANTTDAIGRDTSPARWGLLFNLIGPTAAIGGLKLSQVAVEWKDLDTVEQAELKAFAKEKFDIADDALELTIEKALDIVSNQVAVVEDAIALAKSFKKA